MNQYGPHAQMTKFAGEIKKTVSIPVIAVGRIHDPLVAESVIASGQADMVAMGRGSIADPHLPRKAKEGRTEEIVLCMGCRQVCNANLFAGKPIGCLMDPETCNEHLSRPEAADIPGRVLVVGGGLAGMQAAVIAARRGHAVKLIEKSGKLGGQWLLAMTPPHKDEFGNLVIHLQNKLDALGVEVVLYTEADAQTIKEEGADAVILATGAREKTPDLRIEEGAQVLTSWEVLGLRADTGNRVAVVNCGIPCGETAAFLAAQGKEVTLVERGGIVLRYSDDSVRASLKEELKDLGVKLALHTKATLARCGTLYFETESGETGQMGPFDTFVLGTERESVHIFAMEGWTEIGDANKPGSARQAILDGFAAGAQV